MNVIKHNSARDLPAVWTDDLCYDLFMHALELGQHGNPHGYFLTVALEPFLSKQKCIKCFSEWDYEGIRDWIAHHIERVRLVWQIEIANV